MADEVDVPDAYRLAWGAVPVFRAGQGQAAVGGPVHPVTDLFHAVFASGLTETLVVMLRITDLDDSLDFFCKKLGLVEFSR